MNVSMTIYAVTSVCFCFFVIFYVSLAHNHAGKIDWYVGSCLALPEYIFYCSKCFLLWSYSPRDFSIHVSVHFHHLSLIDELFHLLNFIASYYYMIDKFDWVIAQVSLNQSMLTQQIPLTLSLPLSRHLAQSSIASHFFRHYPVSIKS